LQTNSSSQCYKSYIPVPNQDPSRPTSSHPAKVAVFTREIRSTPDSFPGNRAQTQPLGFREWISKLVGVSSQQSESENQLQEIITEGAHFQRESEKLAAEISSQQNIGQLFRPVSEHPPSWKTILTVCTLFGGAGVAGTLILLPKWYRDQKQSWPNNVPLETNPITRLGPSLEESSTMGSLWSNEPPREALRDNRAAPKAKRHTPPNSHKKVYTNDMSPPLDEPKIKKIDFSCIEERASLSWAKVFRQVAKTLRDPIAELATESQIIHYYNNYRECPPKADVKRLSHIMQRIQLAADFVASHIPELNKIIAIKNIGADLFQIMADQLSKGGDDLLYERTAQIHYDALQIAEDRIRAIQEGNRGIFRDIYYHTAEGAYARIRGETWRLIIRDGRAFASRKDELHEVEFREGRWKFSDETLEEFSMHNVEKEFLKKIHIIPERFTEIPDDNGLFKVESKDGLELLCVHIDSYMVPARKLQRSTEYEAYNANSPFEVGRPIVRSGHIWTFGILKKPRLHLAPEEIDAVRSIASNSLRESLARNYLRNDIDSSSLSRPDSRGLVTSNNGKDYLKFQEGLVEIESIPRADEAYIIKGQDGQRIVSRYDTENQQFIDGYEYGKYLDDREDGTYEWVPCPRRTRAKRGITMSCIPKSEDRQAEEFPLEAFEPIRDQNIIRQPACLDENIGGSELLKKLDLIPEIHDAIRNPTGKCDLVIPDVVKFASENGFSNARYRGIGLWSGPSPESNMLNHYVVVAKKNGVDYVFDLTAGQFENKMPGLTGPIIAREDDWSAIYITSSRRWLIKFRDYNNMKSAVDYFSMPAIHPIQPIENAVVLKAPLWYMMMRNGEVSLDL